MNNTAIFPGSFDPITIGHKSLILRTYELFDKIFIAIGNNSEKKNSFSIEERINWIKETFEGFEKIEVAVYEGLTVDFCKTVGAKYIIRGVRTAADFEFEKGIAQINRKISGIETIILFSEPEYSHISSSVVREIYKYGGDISQFVPENIIEMIKQR